MIKLPSLKVKWSFIPHNKRSPKATTLWFLLAGRSQLSLLPRSPLTAILPFLLDLARFGKSLAIYLFAGINRIISLLWLSALRVAKAVGKLKFTVTRSLIWSRGRLGRPVLHFGVLSLAFGVFMVGGAMQSNFVMPKPWQPDLVMGATDIVPEENTARTTAPSYRQRDEPLDYLVAAGDTLSSIGARYNISVESLEYANNMSGPAYLTPGQKLVIPPMSGLLVTVASGDTVTSLALKYQLAPQAIVDINYLDEPFTLHIGQKLMMPGGKIPPKPVAPVYLGTVVPTLQGGLPLSDPDESVYSASYAYGYQGGEGKTVGTGQLLWPTVQRLVTQYYSSYHNAIDIGGECDIMAADTGTVVRSGWWPDGFGNAVQIDHGNGFVSTYAHMTKLYVSVGEVVEKGQAIGHMGNTGRSFGTHLHFMVQKDGVPVNPLSFF